MRKTWEGIYAIECRSRRVAAAVVLAAAAIELTASIGIVGAGITDGVTDLNAEPFDTSRNTNMLSWVGGMLYENGQQLGREIDNLVHGRTSRSSIDEDGTS